MLLYLSKSFSDKSLLKIKEIYRFATKIDWGIRKFVVDKIVAERETFIWNMVIQPLFLSTIGHYQTLIGDIIEFFGFFLKIEIESHRTSFRQRL